MPSEELSRRERRVLEAVIRSYVETAEPAGSRTLSRRFGLGVSPATIRNTMSDLEEKGFLFHPHTSAGRVPTDKAYRAYVDSLLTRPPLPAVDTVRLSEGLAAPNGSSAIESILRRAAQTLGLLTQELGVAIGPRLDRAVLRLGTFELRWAPEDISAAVVIDEAVELAKELSTDDSPSFVNGVLGRIAAEV